MGRLPSSHFRKKDMKNETQSEDAYQSSGASNGFSGPINFNHLAGGIKFLDHSDTDSDEEKLLAPKPTEPQPEEATVTTTAKARTVGFGLPNRADAIAFDNRPRNGTSVLGHSATPAGGTHVLSARSGVRFSADFAATRWPDATQAKARLVEIVRMLGGTAQLVSFPQVQESYYCLYGDPLDKKEVQKLFGTQPTLKALREHCLDVFEISERSGLIELRMRKEGSTSSTSTLSSAPSDPRPPVTSVRDNYTNPVFRPITVTVAPLSNTDKSAQARRMTPVRLPPERPEIHPTNGAVRSIAPLPSRPSTMKPIVRPTSCFPFSPQPCNASLITPALSGSNRISPVFKPINDGSVVLPSQTVPPAREHLLTQKKKPLPGYTSRGGGDFTESESDEENENSRPPPFSNHASVDASRAHPNTGSISTSNGPVVASETRNQLPPENTQVNTAVAGGKSQPKSIFSSWDQRQAVLQPNDALRGQTGNVPATARNGVISNAQCRKDDSSNIGRKSGATGNASGSNGHASRASSRLSSLDDKLQSMRDIVFAMVKYRHPTPTPLPDVVQLLEQASSNGAGMHDVLGTSTWEFVRTIAGLNVFEERGLIFCAVEAERSDNCESRCSP
ncbi:hypothetical protein AAVH_03324 [Aphelenchoides avenae]|nr:hypothetical protein AAVH_03324 [Aphelenchus avenae]